MGLSGFYAHTHGCVFGVRVGTRLCGYEDEGCLKLHGLASVDPTRSMNQRRTGGADLASWAAAGW